MCSLGPASFLIALVAFQSGGIERMVGLLVKLALRPNLYSTPGLPRILLLSASFPRASSSSPSLFARPVLVLVPAIERNESHVWL